MLASSQPLSAPFRVRAAARAPAIPRASVGIQRDVSWCSSRQRKRPSTKKGGGNESRTDPSPTRFFPRFMDVPSESVARYERDIPGSRRTPNRSLSTRTSMNWKGMQGNLPRTLLTIPRVRRGGRDQSPTSVWLAVPGKLKM
eukprot:scaffold622_cov335-Pavlova_lutheri.AAC.2